MFWLPAIWLCLFMILLGCGLLLATGVARIGGPSFRAPLSTFQVFWFGYAFAIALLQLYSLALPIRAPAVLLLSGSALAGFYVARGPVIARARSLCRRPRRLGALAIVALVTVSIVSSRAAGPVTWYDTQLYHLQVVKWARTYAAVPGIANLHYRLAYNNSVHVFAALTDVFWSGRASHIALGFLVSVLLLQLGWSSLRTGNAPARTAAAFSLLVLPFVLSRIWTVEISSLSTDLALGVVCIVVVLELVRLRARPASQDLALALPLALAAVATTTKLGGAGLLVVVACLALHALRVRGWSACRCLGLGLVPALVLLGYFGRQIILSGRLLFPTPLGNLHLPWSFPDAETLDQFRWIQSWARIAELEPAEVLDHGFWRWFEPWFARFSISAERTLLAATALVACLRLAGPSSLREPAQHAWVAGLAAVVSLLLWFHGAPDLRFGAVFFWILFAVVSAPLLGAALRERAGLPLGVGLCMALTSWIGGFELGLPDRTRSTHIPELEAPPAPVKKLEVSPGLRVFVPDSARGEDRCNDFELPCTPYPARQRMRQPGDLGAGFLY
jgi:hypothetical protein